MDREELLKQVHDAIANGKDIKKIKVKYQTGELIKFDFVNENIEVVEEEEEEEEDEGEEEEVVEVEVEEEEEVVEDDEDEDEDEDDEDEDDEDEDDEDEDDDDDEEENKHTVTGPQNCYQTIQATGRKVNVINRP